MDEGLTQWVAQAKAVRETGRWKALNARILQVRADRSPENGWWGHVIASLVTQNFAEFCSMEYEYGNRPDSALLAWRSRNLLEISVWGIYAESRANARRIYEDAGRDINGILDAFIKWNVAAGRAEGRDPLYAAKDAVAENARLVGGIDSIEGKYKPVSEAADELGFGDYFRANYKLLSKYAHPTAMLLLGNVDEQKKRAQQDFFFSQGCLHFSTTVLSLERTLGLA
jgi:hypothetical protein